MIISHAYCNLRYTQVFKSKYYMYMYIGYHNNILVIDCNVSLELIL